MADWYVSSAAYAAMPQWQATHAYTVGQIIRPLTAQAFTYAMVMRCTGAGNSSSTEPNWPTQIPGNNNSFIEPGGTVTWQNVAGQSTYGWGAAAPNLFSITAFGNGARTTVGDRVFLSSDHSETSANVYSVYLSNAYGIFSVISVNRAGSVPPVAADALSGAAINYNGSVNWSFDPNTNNYWQGITFTLGGTGISIALSNGGIKSHYFKNCAFVFTTSVTGGLIYVLNSTQITFDNTTVQFNAANQTFKFANSYPVDFRWINTPAALPGTVPTILFTGGGSSSPGTLVTCRGVDLSAVTTTLYYGGGAANFGKILLDSCRVAPAVVRLGTGAYSTTDDEVELVNCYDGSNFLAERHTPAGDVTTEFTITLSAARWITSVRSRTKWFPVRVPTNSP